MPDGQERQPSDAGRGRQAASPRDIPAKGWKGVVRGAWGNAGEHNLSLVAGGVTYAVLLALFPGLAALVSIYGLIADPAQIEQQMNAMSGLLPGSAQSLLSDQLHQLASASGGALSIGLAVSVVLALWSASRGMSGLITALDIAYARHERRGFVRFNLVALALTIGLIIGGLIAIALVAGVPAVVSSIGVTGAAKWIAYVVEWPLLIIFLLTMLAVLYRYAPDRDAPHWRWLSPGAVVATLLWITASVLFTIYVSHFGSYNKTYGSLGALVVLLIWLWLSAYVVLLGAEINAESERQTVPESTAAAPHPSGRSGAAAPG